MQQPIHHDFIDHQLHSKSITESSHRVNGTSLRRSTASTHGEPWRHANDVTARRRYTTKIHFNGQWHVVYDSIRRKSIVTTCAPPKLPLFLLESVPHDHPPRGQPALQPMEPSSSFPASCVHQVQGLERSQKRQDDRKKDPPHAQKGDTKVFVCVRCVVLVGLQLLSRHVRT
ncbi:uncharacterized protein BKA78DRAFT_327366 [Phyllosticta capitalensis]|uniref:uncharacterized protein n=1 Tax=Phyllosticta capitalensis TaxID=121624 RepID=UPI0031322565